jgi:transposase
VQGNCITVELGMPGLVVESQHTEGEAIVVAVRFGRTECRCPCCGEMTCQVHQYHRQIKQHRPIWGRVVLLVLRKRRFQCGQCGKVFMEPDDLCGARRRSTLALREMLAKESLASTVKAVANRAEVSEALVRRAFSEWVSKLPGDTSPTPKVLALDEFSIGARRGCLTALYAPQEKRVLQLATGRSQTSAERLLDQLRDGNAVEAVVMDMAESYRQAVRVCCPQAVIVADKFHVISHVLRALQQVCTQVITEAEQRDITALRRRRLFSGAAGTLSPEEQKLRDALLAKYPQLRAAWLMAQSFRSIYASANRNEAARALEVWWAKVQSSGPRPFRGMRHMITRWRDEILNYFLYRETNGFAEGKNNRIKTIMRIGYGYRNVDNLVGRILLTNRGALAA